MRYIIICLDGIVIVAWILCCLSEVLELTSAGLYLECRLLDMRTGVPDFAAGEYAGGDSYRNSLAADEESVAGMSRQQEVQFV